MPSVGPTIADPFVKCPKQTKGMWHNAMVVVYAVMADGREVPRRAICATCRHDWDPSTGRELRPDDFLEPEPGEVSDAENEDAREWLEDEEEFEPNDD